MNQALKNYKQPVKLRYSSPAWTRRLSWRLWLAMLPAFLPAVFSTTSAVGVHQPSEAAPATLSALPPSAPEAGTAHGDPGDVPSNESLPGLGGQGSATPRQPLSRRFMSLLQARSAALLTPDSLRGDTAEKFLTGMQNAALNAALSAGAAEVQGRLPFIRALSVRYESAYASRDDLAELNLMLSLAEKERGALYLQANALAQKGRLGSNLGLGYRLDLMEGLQVGSNFFYDWLEQPDLQRTSVGLEARTLLLDISANLYDALGSEDLSEDGKTVTHGLDGWDLQLQGRLPWLTWLAAEARYYSWNQRFGEADLEGQEYRLLFTPFRLLELRVNYDNPENTPTDWGASLALHYDFGLSLEEHLRRGNPGSSFSENLELRRFEPVRRQARQRHQEVAVVTASCNRSDLSGPAGTLVDADNPAIVGPTLPDGSYPSGTTATFNDCAEGFVPVSLDPTPAVYICSSEGSWTGPPPGSGTLQCIEGVTSAGFILTLETNCQDAPDITGEGAPGYTLDGNPVTRTDSLYEVNTIATYPNTPDSGLTCLGSSTYTCTLQPDGALDWVAGTDGTRSCGALCQDAPDITGEGAPGYTLDGNPVTRTDSLYEVNTIATYPNTPDSGLTCLGSSTYTCTLQPDGALDWVAGTDGTRSCGVPCTAFPTALPAGAGPPHVVNLLEQVIPAGNTVPHASTATYSSCSLEFTSNDGTISFTCNNGSWGNPTTDTLSCTPTCGPAPDPDTISQVTAVAYSTVEENARYALGTTATYTLADPTPNTLVCLGNKSPVYTCTSTGWIRVGSGDEFSRLPGNDDSQRCTTGCPAAGPTDSPGAGWGDRSEYIFGTTFVFEGQNLRPPGAGSRRSCTLNDGATYTQSLCLPAEDITAKIGVWGPWEPSGACSR